MAPPKRTTAGRQKIDIKKIENENARDVCFSKRRMGVFKKASDLATLTGAQIVIIVFSPAGKAYAFGSPNVDDVLNRFLSGGPAPSGLTQPSANAVSDLNNQCMQLADSLEAAKKNKVKLEDRIKAFCTENQVCWWYENADALGLEDLEKLATAMENVKRQADSRITELLSTGVSSSNMVVWVNPVSMMPPNEGTMMPYPAGDLGYGARFY